MAERDQPVISTRELAVELGVPRTLVTAVAARLLVGTTPERWGGHHYTPEEADRIRAEVHRYLDEQQGPSGAQE